MRTSRTSPARHVVVGVIFSTLCSITNAQPAALQNTLEEAVTQPQNISAEALDDLQKGVENNAELQDEPKQRLLATVQKASDALSRALKLEAQASADQAKIEEVPLKVEKLRAELDAPVAELLEDIDSSRSLAELTSALASRQPRLQETQRSLSVLEEEPERQLDRRATIVGDQATHAKRKAEIEEELKAAAPAEEAPVATKVRRALLYARLREVVAEGPAHQAELSLYDAAKAADLLTLQTQLARTRQARLSNEVEQLETLITEKRSNDAKYIAQQLAEFAAGNAAFPPYASSGTSEDLFDGVLTNPQDLKTAKETVNLANENVKATTSLTLAAKELTVAQQQLASLRATRARIDKTLDRVGLNGAIGLELRRQLRTLDDTAVLRQESKARQEAMRDLEFKRLDFEDQATALSARLNALQQREILSDSDRIEWRLTHDRSATLKALQNNYGIHFNRLYELDATNQERIREVEEFRSFIQELVLWIRSNRLPEAEDAAEIVTTAKWFLSPNNWGEVSRTLWEDVKSHIGLYVLITALVSTLFMVQSQFRSYLQEVGETAARPSCRAFYPTARGAVLTTVIAAAWPVLPGFVSWRLLSDATASPFSLAVGRGLLTLAVAFLTLSLLRTLCRPAGLGPAHFGWPAHSVKLLRSQIHTMMVVFLPLMFAEATLHAHENPQGRDALERLLFVVSLLVLAWFQLKIAHPRTGILRDYLSSHTKSWAFRVRWLLYATMVGVPLILAALAIAGYYYTAYELSWRLHVTIWVVIALLVLRSFLIRWFMVNHRHLRMEQARQRRQALLLEQEAESPVSNVPKPPSMEEAVDLKQIGDQTQQFIDSGLALVCLAVMWFVWVNVLPALGVLDTWELWSTTVDATVEFTDKNGVKSLQTEPRLESVTVADGLIAMMLIFLTATAARNVPGLLEMTVLQRLPMEPASRYATKMVARYVIVVVGAIAAAATIGVGWSQVQWLAAALTVGLGFGLQEIFANFVSGLIILFERPVRIGDVVTIADVTGTVSRIHIRATTITDWDRKEYIVPNKEFVTGRLLNWTLSDNTNRIMIKVGVAYGTNTEEARKILLNAAKDHPNVLDDPPPVATFEGFGDSTLDLVLRAYLPNLDNRLGTITELHEVVNAGFASAGIEISFPQLDLHVRRLPEQKS